MRPILAPLCLALLCFGGPLNQPRELVAQSKPDVGVREAVKVVAPRAVNLPAEVKVDVGRLAMIEVGDPNVGWKIVGDDVDSFREYDPARIRIRVLAYKPSIAWLVVSDKDLNITACKITIGVPVPPVPPTPPTPPDPPQPPAPIPGDGLRVLVVYESGAPMSSAQKSTIFGQDFRSYLNSKCPKVGSTPEWRVYDQNSTLTNESQTWRDAMARKRDKLPWIVISTGKTGYEGPLPERFEDIMALVKKYGEGK